MLNVGEFPYSQLGTIEIEFIPCSKVFLCCKCPIISLIEPKLSYKHHDTQTPQYFSN